MNNRKQPELTRTIVGRDLMKVHRFAVSLLTQNGLGDWSVFWEELIEAGDGGGVTHVHSKHIVFSTAFLAMLSSTERRDAVRHEVAHALVGPAAGHSDEWRDKAVELGGSGKVAPEMSWVKYPWVAYCPDGHQSVSAQPSTAPVGSVCDDPTHDAPVPVNEWSRNAKSLAFDPGVKKMAATYPEPVPDPTFSVGETVYILPFGHDEYDNAPVTITGIGKRMYVANHTETGDEIEVVFEGVTAQPSWTV